MINATANAICPSRIAGLRRMRPLGLRRAHSKPTTPKNAAHSLAEPAVIAAVREQRLEMLDHPEAARRGQRGGQSLGAMTLRGVR